MLEVTIRPTGASTQQARRAAFVVPPSGPNQVWQLDFSEFETRGAAPGGSAAAPTTGRRSSSAGTYRPTQNQHDAITAVELALTETERLLGCSLIEHLTDPDTGEIVPIALVTDNGGCFKAAASPASSTSTRS